MANLICDFCTLEPAPEPHKIYMRDPQVAALVANLSTGETFVDQREWLACCHCRDAIDGQQWLALVSRCTFGMLAASHIPATHENIDRVEARMIAILTIILGQKFSDGLIAQRTGRNA